jgi:hypothetical protein
MPHNCVLDELERLQRMARRGSPRRARTLVMDRILEAHAMAIQGAFMTGRIYATGGEKEEPGDIQQKLRENVARAERMAIVEHRKQHA